MNILGTQLQGLFAGRQSRLELTQGEMNFRLCEPRLKASRIECDRLL